MQGSQALQQPTNSPQQIIPPPIAGISSSPSMYQKPTLLSYFMFILQGIQSIKLIVKMGNIQIKEPTRKSQPIFKNRPKLKSLSPFKEALSPKNPNYRKLSPIKYTMTNSYYKGGNLSTQKPVKKVQNTQEKNFFQRTNSKTPISVKDNLQNGYENRWKCEQIIKKVRNFNDFLVHLKKKLEQNTAEKHGDYPIIKGEVSMNVKLENQRIQLSKYKRLVERQLSKTHSIEQISIQNISNGEKVLTIHYQNMSNGSQKNLKKNVSPLNFKNLNYEQIIQNQEMTEPNQQEYYNSEQFQKGKENSKAKVKLLREAKALGEVLRKRCEQIHNQLTKHKKEDKLDISLQFLLKQKEKDMKISSLLQSLEETNKQSLNLEEKVRKLIS